MDDPSKPDFEGSDLYLGLDEQKGGTLLADARDRLLAPWLNSFWAPRGLAAARPLGIVVAPRGRVIAVVVLLCAIAYIAYVPDSALFDGDPKLSKQLGTAAGDCMALALVPIPKRSILLPMTLQDILATIEQNKSSQKTIL